ncbi:MAG: hypothetical protein JXA62_09255 [Candidatus Aminicenantes bacterium]|nr:hypothetical protein [Candidatus Aminicenantes bacterium]
MVLEPSSEVDDQDLQSGVLFRLQSRGSSLCLELAGVRNIRGEWVLTFAGCHSISEAYRLVGFELWLDRPADAKNGESDSLLGFDVVDTEGNACGVVVEAHQREINPLLELEFQGRRVLVPWHPEIVVHVDLISRRVVISPPRGLMDLNA